MQTRKLLVVVLAVGVLFSTLARAAEDEPSEQVKRLNASAAVLDEIMKTPDKGIPEEILGSAECVAVIPSMVKIGFIFGGRHGRGLATCRTKSGGWSAPAPFSITGGSWGLQIGGEAVDVVMLAMNDQGMAKMLSSKFKIGADASAAAGPVGRHAEADTDWKMKSQILTYSRARGIFAGVTVNGASIKQDKDGTRILYGKMIPSSDILRGTVAPPEGSHQFMAAVRKYSGQAQAADASEHKQDRQERAESASDARPAKMLTSSEAQNAIVEKLKSEPGLNSSKVDVALTAGTVKLSGTVPSEEDRDKVVRIAKSYAGNREVQDQLAVQAQ
jgi:SH3 domain-containing YSC84-like protein 1